MSMDWEDDYFIGVLYTCMYRNVCGSWSQSHIPPVHITTIQRIHMFYWELLCINCTTLKCCSHASHGRAMMCNSQNSTLQTSLTYLAEKVLRPLHQLLCTASVASNCLQYCVTSGKRGDKDHTLQGTPAQNYHLLKSVVVVTQLIF